MGDGVMGDDRSFEGGRGFIFKDVLIELMESVEDVNLSDDQHQCQFVLSPTPNPSGSNRKLFSSNAESVDSSSSTRSNNINGVFKLGDEFNDSGLAGPDLGWVNELLM
ncbi:hypothetical protein Nepgr_012917 [Nepenthes gracilis]|uniref:Uncharacterized protein n=1 Tax=Nepenthes gracilis TaxID=150966 RepID=A0AAD3SHY9_NEPGR|nr:hypothetical protein Nepgr_012917 [Nepenthes gracilis]